MKYYFKSIYRKLLPEKIRSTIYTLRGLSSMRREMDKLRNDADSQIIQLRNELLYLKIIDYFRDYGKREYESELNYLKKHGSLEMYPYEKTNLLKNVQANFDSKKRMPFVMHDGKKLYFPEDYSIEAAIKTYSYFVAGENILGDSYLEKAPHQYITKQFNVHDGDIVLDLGAAEGLFMLDAVDKAKRGYLFEPNKYWAKALQATFEPYSDKIVFVDKFVTDKDSSNSITIDTCLKNESGNIFIKMDVDGYELSALNGSKTILKRNDDIRVVCCTYHNQDDANDINNLFKEINFYTAFSDGYVIFFHDSRIKPPYFRKGVIRAKNSK